MRKVFLHIGHGKTGTSATQTALARLHLELRERGVCYPEHPSFDSAAKGLISSGNLNGSQSDWFAEQVLPAIRNNEKCATFVFSNENIFWLMDQFFETVHETKNDLDFHVLLSVRDPSEMLSSAYMQAVKRGGYTGTLEEYSIGEGHIIRAAQLICRMKELGVEFTVLNYSRLKHDITKHIFELIGVGDLFDDSQQSKLGKVNRSLSNPELQAVILVNQIFGAARGASVSDALVNKLPQVDADTVILAESSLKRFYDRVRDSVQVVNSYLPKGEKISLSLKKHKASTETPSLSEEQKKVIQEALDLKLLTDEDAPMLYGAALTQEAGQVLSKTQATMLLRLAARAKPNGPMIRQKLNEFISDL